MEEPHQFCGICFIRMYPLETKVVHEGKLCHEDCASGIGIETRRELLKSDRRSIGDFLRDMADPEMHPPTFPRHPSRR